ncbi:MAG: penicillin-binding transpeptidase domain-containing protein [Oscillospiraceae bacterium]|nr:penicillin-binding transpeptidase domain-containing protein [Oscillospiraceae bacterium]
MSKPRLYIRIGILGLMTLAFAAVLVITLFDLQIIQTVPEAAARAERRYTTEIGVAAARGEVFDRYGRPLITNVLGYNITLNHRQLTLADANEFGSSARGILNLIALCRREDTLYEDTFPVTYEPYRYINDMTSAQDKRLKRFLDEIEQPDFTAEELMVFLRERYKIPEEFSDDDARLVIGVRYELELRTVFFNIPPYIFADGISVKLLTLIEERRLPGVSVNSVTTREYRTDFAAHLLGRVGQIPESRAEEYLGLGYSLDAIVGIDGVEKAAESWLKGVDGIMSVETTISGQITAQRYRREPQAGNHIITTLDLRLQEAVERALERGIEDLRATGVDREGGAAAGGAVAVIDINSGEILAMASYPTFSLINFKQNFQIMNEDPSRPMYNRAIAGTYAPGSIYKMCTAIAALEYEIVKPRTTIFDNVRYMFYAPSYTPRCNGSHGSVNVYNSLKVSCNYYYYEVGRLLKIDRLGEYAMKMGFGRKSGIELDGESIGVLASQEYVESQNLRWMPGDTIQAAIGQSYNSFTPLQMAVYTATIANGGLHYRPHILKSARSYDFRRETFDNLPEIMDDLELDPDNIKAVQEGMRMAAQAGGTAARIFASYPIPVAAKTGTAQTSANRPDNGVFVAYAPYENPEIAVAVVVEKGAGGSRVAPIAREVFSAYFDIKARMTAIDTEG